MNSAEINKRLRSDDGFLRTADATAPYRALVENGCARYTIVYPENWIPDFCKYRDPIFYELADYIRQVTGVPMEVRGASESIGACEIYIGMTEEPDGENQKKRIAEGTDLSFDPALYGDDGYVIRTCGSRYVIIGTSVVSTKKAVGVFASEFCRNAANDPSTLLVPAVIRHASSGMCETDAPVSVSIGGTTLASYAIVIPANESEQTFSAAQRLRRTLLDLTAEELQLHRSTDGYTGKKIRIGQADLPDRQYRIRIKDGDLFLEGADSRMTALAADRFTADLLRIRNGRYAGESPLVIPADLDRTYDSAFRIRLADCASYPSYLRDTAAKLLGAEDSICYSDKCTADRLYDALSGSGAQSGGEVFLIHNRAGHCECDACRDNPGAFFETVNEIAKRFAAKGVTVSTLAYRETRHPPKMRTEKNVRVYFAEPETCCAHAIDDDTCEINRPVCADLAAWTKVCSDVCVLDFSQNYFHYPATFPDLRVLRPDFAYYKKIGVSGVIMAWDPNNAQLEFGELRSILIRALLDDPEMRPDLYRRLFDETMAELYPSHAQQISEYIRKFEAASAEHFTIFSKPREILPIPKSDGTDGADAYDLTLAKEFGQIWEDAYDRHDPPEKALSAPAMCQLYRAYLHADYYQALHARVQYSAWIDDNVPVCDRADVYRAIIGSFLT